ncbi:MAG TPA: hypothetical protein VFH90_07290 [Candidatus Limnocylindria bacterium]|nr:hypothetical protein [Candidatus Limnocylindria bacterium]
MTREFTDLLADWLADAAPGEAPDWIVHRIIDRTAAIPHRHRLRLTFASTPFIAAGLTLAAVALALVVGIGFGSLLNRSGGPDESATPSPTASPSPVPRPTDIPVDGSCEPERDCLGILDPGTYRSDLFDPPVAYTVPVNGWQNWRNSGGMVVLLPLGARGDELVLMQDATPRTADGRVPSGVGDGATGFMAWLASRTDLDVSEPQAASIGGLGGQSVELRVRDDAPNGINGCPARPCVAIAYGIDSATRPTWTWDLHVWRGAASRLTVLENGDRLVLLVVTAWYGDELGALLDRSQQIVDSLRFDS